MLKRRLCTVVCHSRVFVIFWKKFLEGNIQKFPEQTEFIRIDVTLPNFDFCQSAAGNIAVVQLEPCR